MDIIRVCSGVYRTEPAGVSVFYRPWQDQDLPWVVCWTDIFTVRHELRFATLHACRNYLSQIEA